MRVDITEIEVYIMSHERPQLLVETLECFLDQTIQGFSITVLDNSVENDISPYMLSYQDKGVKVVYSDKNVSEPVNNLQRARLLSSKKWVIAFHDDDLVHPQYIEHVLEAINSVENLSLIGTLTKRTDRPENNYWKRIDSSEIVLYENASDFAAAIFKGMHVPFCSVVYRTEFFKTVPVRSEFGKMMDRPFMYDCANTGRVAVLNKIYVQTRTNSVGRDSNTYTNGPFSKEFFALLKEYRLRLGDSIFTKNGRTFLLRGTSFLLMNSPWEYHTPEENVDKKKYVKEAVSFGTISWGAFFAGMPYYILYKFYKMVSKRP